MQDEQLTQWVEYTETLIEELIEDGTNEEKMHTIEHHFSSPDFDLLEKAAVAAFKMGLEIEEPEEAELENGDKVFAFDIVSEHYLDEEDLMEEIKKMLVLANQNKVDYDGWGTYFEE